MFSKLSISILILYFSSSALGAPNAKGDFLRKPPNGRIIGGQDANIEDYPHQVSVTYYGSHICGGSIVGERFILTAAHCTHGTVATFLRVYVGSSTLYTGGTAYRVRAVYEHPTYNIYTYNYDVSILELYEPLTFNTTVAPIALGDIDLQAGTEVQVTGWGTTDEDSEILSTQLQVVNITVVSRWHCALDYGIDRIYAEMLCAGDANGGKDSCLGDSGGALIRNGTQYGIVSWGYGCGEVGYPGVYANIVGLRDFIDPIIN